MHTTIESTAAFNDLLYLLTGGYLGLFMLGLITMVLFFFLPFIIFGIWNQTKRTNKNLQKLIELLQVYENRLKLIEKDSK
tara:strand:- start:908 stop:1147 length:240 start_codon:yes stop_codon:yes gene_type:complete